MMSRILIPGAPVFVAVWLLAACSAAGEVAVAAPSLDEIIAGLKAAEGRLFDHKSVMMRFERVKSENVTEHRGARGNLLLTEWTFAFMNNRWFAQHRFTEPRRLDNHSVIPPKPITILVRDGFVLDWNQTAANAAILEYKDYDNLCWNEYTKNLSANLPLYVARSYGMEDQLDAMRKRSADDVDLPFLPEYLERHKDRYRVLAQPENIGGAACWVVEWPGMDRFCIDPQRGFCIPRRTYQWGPGKATRYHLENDAYRQVIDGLWLPYRQVQERYYDPQLSTPELRGKVRYRTEYVLHDIAFDTLADDFFQVELPAGTYVNDAVRHFRYRVARGGAAPFGSPLSGAAGELRPAFSRWLLLSINALIVIMLVAFLVVRRFHVGLPRAHQR